MIKISSFMRYEFSQRSWIEVSSKRYSVRQCLLRNGIGEFLLPYAVEPDLDSYITNLKQPVSEKLDIRLILTKIGAAETFADLSTNALYGILLMLPTFDEIGEISKALYQSIIDDHGISSFRRKRTRTIKNLWDPAWFIAKMSRHL